MGRGLDGNSIGAFAWLQGQNSDDKDRARWIEGGTTGMHKREFCKQITWHLVLDFSICCFKFSLAKGPF